MAYGLVGVTARVRAYNGTLAPGVPAAAVAGNLLILQSQMYAGNVAASSLASPGTNWSFLGPQSSTGVNNIGYWANLTDLTAPILNWGTINVDSDAYVLAYSGNQATLTNIIHAIAAKQNNGNGIITWSNLTITADGCLVLLGGAKNNVTASQGASFNTVSATTGGPFVIDQSVIENTFSADISAVTNRQIQTTATSVTGASQTLTVNDGTVQGYSTVAMALFPQTAIGSGTIAEGADAVAGVGSENILVLDGSASVLNAGGSAGSITLTLTTTQSPDVIVVAVVNNGGSGVSSMTSAHLTFAKRATAAISAYNDIEEWYAIASAPLSSEVITIAFTDGSTPYNSACAFGIANANTSVIFDSNGALPVQNTAAADPTFSTTSAKTLVFGLMRFSTTSSASAGSGWKSIYAPAGGAFLVQYRVFSLAQSGATCSVGTGSNNENGSIVDAVIVFNPVASAGSGAIAEGSDVAMGAGAVAVTGSGAATESADSVAGLGFTHYGVGAITESSDSVGGATIGLDGTAVYSWATGTTFILPGLTTTQANDVIVVGVTVNGGAPVASVTSPNLTFSLRATTNSGSNDAEEWTAIASSILSSEVITISFAGGGAYISAGAAVAFAVKNSTTAFDSNVALPVFNTTAADPAFSTTSPNTLAYGILRFSGATPTASAGAGWTGIYNPTGEAFLAQYEIFSSPQSGTTCVVGTGTNNENGAIVDALVAVAAGASGTVAVSGSGALTESADVATGTGTVAVSGVGTTTEGNDAPVVGTGTVKVTGIGTISEGADSATGVGVILGYGLSAIHEGVDIVAGAGTVAVTGSGASTENADSSSGAGGVMGVGVGPIIESSDSVAGAGVVSVASGTDNIKENGDSVAGIGKSSSGTRTLSSTGAGY